MLIRTPKLTCSITETWTGQKESLRSGSSKFTLVMGEDPEDDASDSADLLRDSQLNVWTLGTIARDFG
jgi:hypothetical protein